MRRTALTILFLSWAVSARGEDWLADPDLEEVLVLIQEPLSRADCDEDGVPDRCAGAAADCDGDGLTDLCEIRLGLDVDCNANDVPDTCDLESTSSADCNGNGIPDECDIASGESLDLVENGVPDECESDCNRNGVLDATELDRGLVADCNRNGTPDDCDISWNLGFSEPVDVLGPAFDGSRPEGPPVLADLDGDGDEDMALALPSAVVIAWRLDGGRFAEARLPLAFSPRSVASADFDGDGDLDLLTVNASDAVNLPANASLIENEGSGNFAPPRNFALDEEAHGVVAADLDGDGDADAAVLDGRFSPSNISIIRNDGGSLALGEQIPLRAASSWLAAADFNGDARDELLWIVPGTRQLVVAPRPDRLVLKVRHDLPEIPHAAAVADLDADGDPDVAVVGQEQVFVFLNTSGELELLASYAGGAPRTSLTRLAVGDPDGDGDLDIVISTPPTRVFVLENLGPGSFLSRTVRASIGSPVSSSLLDLDDDGREDLLFTTGSGLEVSFSIVGTSSDCNGNRVPDECDPDCNDNGVADACDIAVHGDCNGNGVPDTCDVAPSLSLRPSGEMELTAPLWHLAVADIDGDGMKDLFTVTTRFLGTVLRNAGNLAFGPLESVRFPAGLRTYTLADFDGDGDDDLAMGSKDVRIFMNDNSGLRASSMVDVGASVGGIASLASGDLDGDGDLDIAAGSANRSAPHSLLVFRNDTLPAPSRDRNHDGFPDECDRRIPFHRGDPDGDGRITLTDGIVILRVLFLGEEPSRCRESEDFTNDGRVDVTDAVALFRFLFLGGAPPPPPGPPEGPCGMDTDPPGSSRDLGCEVYERC